MIVSRIIFGKRPLRKKLKHYLLYLSKKKGAAAAWNKRHTELFQKNPYARVDIDAEVETEHRNIWKQFWSNVPIGTLTVCNAIADNADPYIIPEEIYQADIEPSLNSDTRANFLAHKSYYQQWFPECGFPICYVHKLDGIVMNGKMERIDSEDLVFLVKDLSYPVLAKPCMDANGGVGVLHIKNPDDMETYIINNDNFVVQEIIQQSRQLSKYHPESVNTVRVYLYRSFQNNKIHIINRVLRTGNGGIVDNVSAGGLVCFIHESGELNGFALDKYGRRYDAHPLTEVEFKGVIPKLDQLDQLAKKVAHQLHYLRVVGLDLCYDVDEGWRMLEVNTRSHSIRFAQYAGHPFFGEFTEEVIEYCKKNHWAITG